MDGKHFTVTTYKPAADDDELVHVSMIYHLDERMAEEIANQLYWLGDYSRVYIHDMESGEVTLFPDRAVTDVC